MESSKYNVAYICAPICTNRLIFGKWTFWQPIPSYHKFLFPSLISFSSFSLLFICMVRWWSLMVAGKRSPGSRKPGFHMLGKSQAIGDLTFCRPTVPDFADILDNRQTPVSDTPCLCVGTGAQQFRGLVISEIYRRRPRRYKFEFSFAGNDRQPSQKSGTLRENRNTPDSPD